MASRTPMKDHNALRLQRIAARFEAHRDLRSDAEASRDLRAFLSSFEGAIADVIRPAMTEIAEELRAAGHILRFERTERSALPCAEFHFDIRDGKAQWRNAIVFFVAPRGSGGWEVIAELELQTPSELTRFASPGEITPEVVEQMLVDAVEQMFACNEA